MYLLHFFTFFIRFIPQNIFSPLPFLFDFLLVQAFFHFAYVKVLRRLTLYCLVWTKRLCILKQTSCWKLQNCLILCKHLVHTKHLTKIPAKPLTNVPLGYVSSTVLMRNCFDLNLKQKQKQFRCPTQLFGVITLMETIVAQALSYWFILSSLVW